MNGQPVRFLPQENFVGSSLKDCIFNRCRTVIIVCGAGRRQPKLSREVDESEPELARCWFACVSYPSHSATDIGKEKATEKTVRCTLQTRVVTSHIGPTFSPGCLEIVRAPCTDVEIPVRRGYEDGIEDRRGGKYQT